jgi:ABC-type sugar transport system ATPase subunit
MLTKKRLRKRTKVKRKNKKKNQKKVTDFLTLMKIMTKKRKEIIGMRIQKIAMGRLKDT